MTTAHTATSVADPVRENTTVTSATVYMKSPIREGKDADVAQREFRLAHAIR